MINKDTLHKLFTNLKITPLTCNLTENNYDIQDFQKLKVT